MIFLRNKETFCALIVLLTVVSFTGAYAQEKAVTKLKSGNLVFDSVPLNLEEITNSANRIFTGICTSIEEIENDSESKNLSVVKFKFKVTEAIKGITSDDEITLKFWQPAAKGANYKVGEKYILFLYKDSDLGFTSPVGYLQGQFQVEKTGANRKVEFVRNKLSNKGIYRNIKTQRTINLEKDKILNDYISKSSEEGKPIRYKDFVQTVRYLIKE